MTRASAASSTGAFEIDRWVTGRAIDMLAEQRALGRDLRFEVNLSGHTIGDEPLLELVERQLHDQHIPPDRLIFEVTETAAVANIARAAVFAERLSELGCKFALDDFGAGFGSFYYLKHLPFDYMKIDGEFVRHCASNETDRILISAVVQIARGMGKRTIAEYVTNQETVEVLTRLGVDYGQGFHLGRRAPSPTTTPRETQRAIPHRHASPNGRSLVPRPRLLHTASRHPRDCYTAGEHGSNVQRDAFWSHPSVISRSRASELRSSRETCIWETPICLAIAVWVRSSPKRRYRI